MIVKPAALNGRRLFGELAFHLQKDRNPPPILQAVQISAAFYLLHRVFSRQLISAAHPAASPFKLRLQDLQHRRVAQDDFVLGMWWQRKGNNQ